MIDQDGEFMTGLAYRHGYALGRDARDKELYGVNLTGPDSAKLLARLLAQVQDELGTTDPTGQKQEAIEEGIRDAVEGRRPAW